MNDHGSVHIATQLGGSVRVVTRWLVVSLYTDIPNIQSLMEPVRKYCEPRQ